MLRVVFVKLLARLDSSPLPAGDGVRLSLEWELLGMLAAYAPKSAERPLPVRASDHATKN